MTTGDKVDHQERARQYENVLRLLLSRVEWAPARIRTAASIIEEDGGFEDDIAEERDFADEMEKAVRVAKDFLEQDVKARFSPPGP